MTCRNISRTISQEPVVVLLFTHGAGVPPCSDSRREEQCVKMAQHRTIIYSSDAQRSLPSSLARAACARQLMRPMCKGSSSSVSKQLRSFTHHHTRNPRDGTGGYSPPADVISWCCARVTDCFVGNPSYIHYELGRPKCIITGNELGREPHIKLSVSLSGRCPSTQKFGSLFSR